MSVLREQLTRTLAKKVEAHGIVVWEDPHREYDGVAEACCPPAAAFARWRGGWYRLRHDLEEAVSGQTPPALVIYQPVQTPSEDPLAEIRDSGHAFRRRLATLLREALIGELTETRIEELAAGGRTLLEVEVALTSGEGTGVRLPAALGTADTLQLALRILADNNDAKLSADNLWEEARAVLGWAFGGDPTGEGENLKAAVFRHVLLLELKDMLGDLPRTVQKATGRATADQRRRARELLATWRSDLHRIASYRERALHLEQELGLKETVRWSDALTELDSFPALEDVALIEVVRRLADGEIEAAETLAATRLEKSLWVRGDVPESSVWAPTWTAGAAVAQLRAEIVRISMPSKRSAEAFLTWYADQGWRVDRAHRRMEAALTEVAAYGALEEPVREARGAYERWLEDLLQQFTTAVEQEGLETEALLRQGAIHKEVVARADESVAYFLVDALRYELGEELARALTSVTTDVEFRPAVAAAPTITPVGMANLLPGSEAGLKLALGSKHDLQVLVDGTPVRDISDRVSLLRAAHGPFADLLLTEIFDQGEVELQERIGTAHIVLVRSQEIDEALESDKTAAGWRYIKELKSLITRAVARLVQAGISRVVITSDHGFLILSRALGPDRIINSPGGQGELHRRCWVGRGGAAAPSTLRVAVADVGLQGDLDLIVPRGLAVFGAGGARRFFHGGLSPQELLIPVITARPKERGAPQRVKVNVRIAGDRVMTGVFSAAIDFQPDLFNQEITVRILAHNKRGDEVARVVTGEGYDEQTAVTLLKGTRTQLVTLRVTRNLVKGDRVVLEVYDAKTDRLLGKSPHAQVVTGVEGSDEFD